MTPQLDFNPITLKTGLTMGRVLLKADNFGYVIYTNTIGAFSQQQQQQQQSKPTKSMLIVTGNSTKILPWCRHLLVASDINRFMLGNCFMNLPMILWASIGVMARFSARRALPGNSWAVSTHVLYLSLNGLYDIKSHACRNTNVNHYCCLLIEDSPNRKIMLKAISSTHLCHT